MAATITASGTWTTPAIVGKAVGGSGVAFTTPTGTPGGTTTFDSRTSLQKGTNLFDELNQFVTLMAAALGVAPIVVLDTIENMISDMRRQPNMAERSWSA